MPRKGTTSTRKLKHGPRKGTTAKMVSIRNGSGAIRNSYEVYSPAKYAQNKRSGKKGHH